MKTKLIPVGIAMAVFPASLSHAALNVVDTTAIRALAESERNEWEVFTEANGAPGNLGDIRSDSGATLTQTNIGVGLLTSGGNLYSPFAPIAVRMDDAPGYVDVSNNVFVGNVVLQFATLGTPVDHGTLTLTYLDNASAAASLAAAGFQKSATTTTVITPGGESESVDETVAYQWDLTGLNAVSYRIEFSAAGSSLSLDKVALDSVSTSHAFQQVVVPEPGSVALLAISGMALVLSRHRRSGGARIESNR